MLSSTFVDEVGYLTYGPDAANVLFHVVDNRHLKKRPMVFTTNKAVNEWGRVLHDPDLAAAILDRILERGRWITLDGPSGRTKHLKMETSFPQDQDGARISGTHTNHTAYLQEDVSLNSQDNAAFLPGYFDDVRITRGHTIKQK